jgi:hypothetical protein
VSLPYAFCWSKFGQEAGETSWSIRIRKEFERRRNEGVFLWGIGNSIRPSLLDLLHTSPTPEVIFTPMLSPASPADARPSALALWLEAVTMGGNLFRLPTYSVVTSRYPTGQARRRHYALVCRTNESIDVDRVGERIDSAAVCNLRTGSSLGASQVTAVVRRVQSDVRGRQYRVAFRAFLIHPYLVELTTPLAIPEELRIDRYDSSRYEEIMAKLLEIRERAGPSVVERPIFS